MTNHDDAYIRYIQNFFQRWAGVYDAFAWSIAPYYRAVADVIPAKTSVLDICTGTGQISCRLAAKGCSVTAVDISEAMLSRAKKRASTEKLAITFQQLDARELPFADGSFDWVVLSFCLHDMPKKVRIAVLQQALRVARGPVVVADYEFPPNPWISKLYLHGIALFETPYFKSFAREPIANLLQESGGVVSKRQRVFFGMFSIYTVSRLA